MIWYDEQLALDNADAIAAIPGVTSIMLGPGDLRLSLGLPSRKFGERDDPRFLAAIDQLVGVSQRQRKPLMTVSFKGSATEDSWITHFNLLLMTADFVNVVKGHQRDLETVKNMIGEMLKAQKSTDDGNEIIKRTRIEIVSGIGQVNESTYVNGTEGEIVST